YDLAMASNRDTKIDAANQKYIRELIVSHVSGRLKVAPEHTSAVVLDCMRKPSFSLFRRFKRIFDEVNDKCGLRQQLIPYFISSHPACREEDMAELAIITKELDFHLEQVQDFTPTPMTLATEIYYTGIHPYTGESVFTAKSEKEKLAQRQFFFWYKPEARASIVGELKKMHRNDLIDKLYSRKKTMARNSYGEMGSHQYRTREDKELDKSKRTIHGKKRR
ncbi:MAG: DUF3362 domain-containing protein, partial [Muribaculaceae bacterium]|nr:DUF3362 domain-containing protein [Muribaculaceae bacterium]